MTIYFSFCDGFLWNFDTTHTKLSLKSFGLIVFSINLFWPQKCHFHIHSQILCADFKFLKILCNYNNALWKWHSLRSKQINWKKIIETKLFSHSLMCIVLKFHENASRNKKVVVILLSIHIQIQTYVCMNKSISVWSRAWRLQIIVSTHSSWTFCKTYRYLFPFETQAEGAWRRRIITADWSSLRNFFRRELGPYFISFPPI